MRSRRVCKIILLLLFYSLCGRAGAGKGITPLQKQQLFAHVSPEQKLSGYSLMWHLQFWFNRTLSIIIWDHRKPVCKSRFNYKVILTVIKNNFKTVTSAKLLFCRHPTPANTKYTTDVGEKAGYFSLLSRRLKNHFSTGKQILSLLEGDYTLIPFEHIWFCWHVCKYQEIKTHITEHVKALMLFCSNYIMTQEKWRS